jgi:small subunit ribosomal protein S20
MANLPSVEKRNRQSLKRRARNQVVRTQVKGAVKAARAALEAKDPARVTAALVEAMRVVGKARSKGVLHPRTAARRIARLSKAAAGLRKK